MRFDIMVDIETLGNELDSSIIQVAAIAFDMKSGEYLSEFLATIDIEKSKDLKVTGSTLKWWLQTDKELLRDILQEGMESEEEVARSFYDWIKSHGVVEEIYLWGNGILFDNALIKEFFRKHGLPYPIHYKNDRDVRTILEMACLKEKISESMFKELIPRKGRVHHAMSDVKYQIDLVTTCYEIIIGDDVDD